MTASGHAGNDIIYGGGGRDTIRAHGLVGNDMIYGGSHPDYIEASNGDDYIDLVKDDAAIDYVISFDGVDTVKAHPRDHVDPDCENVTRVRNP